MTRKDDDGDAGRESDRHRIWDELDVGAEAQKAGRHQNCACHHRGEQYAIDAMALHGGGDQHDERTRRPANLKPAAAECGHQEAANDRCVQAAVRRGAGGNRNRHGKRQRDDRDGEAGNRVGAQVGEAVAFAQHRYKLGRE